ncbi:MAG TPA: SRPBCC family protein [Bryobacteraceae bacterium]|nr:SRPBCC family protein [Bryobacteraceae bacterium]
MTTIRAPQDLCFDLARSVDLHIESMSATGETAVAGVTRGLIGLNEEVTWEATHFLVRQRLTSRITAFDRPSHFRDSQVRGAFRRFDHDHFFASADGGTQMTDVFDYTSPFGLLGILADHILLERYMRALIARRAEAIKAEAERRAAKIDP